MLWNRLITAQLIVNGSQATLSIPLKEIIVFHSYCFKYQSLVLTGSIKSLEEIDAIRPPDRVKTPGEEKKREKAKITHSSHHEI